MFDKRITLFLSTLSAGKKYSDSVIVSIVAIARLLLYTHDKKRATCIWAVVRWCISGAILIPRRAHVRRAARPEAVT